MFYIFISNRSKSSIITFLNSIHEMLSWNELLRKINTRKRIWSARIIITNETLRMILLDGKEIRWWKIDTQNPFLSYNDKIHSPRTRWYWTRLLMFWYNNIYSECYFVLQWIAPCQRIVEYYSLCVWLQSIENYMFTAIPVTKLKHQHEWKGNNRFFPWR